MLSPFLKEKERLRQSSASHFTAPRCLGPQGAKRIVGESGGFLDSVVGILEGFSSNILHLRHTEKTTPSALDPFVDRLSRRVLHRQLNTRIHSLLQKQRPCTKRYHMNICGQQQFKHEHFVSACMFVVFRFLLG